MPPRLVLRLCLGSDFSPCQWDCDMDICIQGGSWEVPDGRKLRLRGKLTAMHLQQRPQLTESMGSSGVKMALQSCTRLRQGARPLHQQLLGAGCPWVGAKPWVSQTRAIPKVEHSYEPSQQWDGAQLPSSSGSKFDHTSTHLECWWKLESPSLHSEFLIQQVWGRGKQFEKLQLWELPSWHCWSSAQNHCLGTNAEKPHPVLYTFSSVSLLCESSSPTAGMYKEP